MKLSPGKIFAVVASVLAVLSLAAAGFLGLRYFDARMTENARNDAVAAGKQYAATMFGYTPQNIDAHIEQTRRVLMGSASADYDRLVNDSKLAAGVKEQGIVSEVTIQDAGVVTGSATRDSAQVLLFMNQSVTRGNKELVRIDPSRLTYTMNRENGVWKISAIDVITDDSFRSKLAETDGAPAGGIPLSPTASAPGSGAPTSTPAVPTR